MRKRTKHPHPWLVSPLDDDGEEAEKLAAVAEFGDDCAAEVLSEAHVDDWMDWAEFGDAQKTWASAIVSDSCERHGYCTMFYGGQIVRWQQAYLRLPATIDKIEAACLKKARQNR